MRRKVKDWEEILRRICRLEGEDVKIMVFRNFERGYFPWEVRIWSKPEMRVPLRFSERTRRKAVLLAVLSYSQWLELVPDLEYDGSCARILERPGVYEELDLALGARGA